MRHLICGLNSPINSNNENKGVDSGYRVDLDQQIDFESDIFKWFKIESCVLVGFYIIVGLFFVSNQVDFS